MSDAAPETAEERPRFTIEREDTSAAQAEMEENLEESIKVIETFTMRFLDHIGADVEEVQEGVFRVRFEGEYAQMFKRDHLIMFDPEVYSKVEDQQAELVTPASPLFRKMMTVAESIGPLTVLRTRRATPYTLYHFHVRLEGMNYEWESLVTVAIDDDGDVAADAPPVDELVRRIEAGEYEVVKDATALPDHERHVPEISLERAPHYLRQQISAKLDELTGAVEAGLRKTHERIHSYYEQMRDEVRNDEIRLRRRIGEINSRIWYVEDNIRLMKLEKEREVLSKELNEAKTKTQKVLEHLEMEENERLAKESERAEPQVKLTLVAATRILGI